MHYCLPIGHFDKTKPCQFSSVQLLRLVCTLSSSRRGEHLPASLMSRVKFAARPEKPFFSPLPLATTRLASPWKRLAVTAPGFFSTVSTNNDDVTAISDPLPAPDTTTARRRTYTCIQCHVMRTAANDELSSKSAAQTFHEVMLQIKSYNKQYHHHHHIFVK